MPVTMWRPDVAMRPVISAFPSSVAKAAGLARSRAPIRTGQLRRSIRPVVTGALGGAISVSVPYAAAQEFGSAAHTIGEGGKVLSSKAPGGYKPGAKVLPGKRSTRQNFGPVRGPVHHPGTKGKGFVRLAAMAWRAIYIAEVRKRFPH